MGPHGGPPGHRRRLGDQVLFSDAVHLVHGVLLAQAVQCEVAPAVGVGAGTPGGVLLDRFQVVGCEDAVSVSDVYDVLAPSLHLAHVCQQLDQVGAHLGPLVLLERLADGGQPEVGLGHELLQSSGVLTQHEDLAVQVMSDPPVSLDDGLPLVPQGLGLVLEVVLCRLEEALELPVGLGKVWVSHEQRVLLALG